MHWTWFYVCRSRGKVELLIETTRAKINLATGIKQTEVNQAKFNWNWSFPQSVCLYQTHFLLRLLNNNFTLLKFAINLPNDQLSITKLYKPLRSKAIKNLLKVTRFYIYLDRILVFWLVVINRIFCETLSFKKSS